MMSKLFSFFTEHMAYFLPLLNLPYIETYEATLFDSVHNYPCKTNIEILKYFEESILSNQFYNLLNPKVNNSDEKFHFKENVYSHKPETYLPLHYDIAKKLEKKFKINLLTFRVIGTYKNFLSMDSLPPLIQYFPDSFEACQKKVHTIYLMFQLKKSISSNIRYFSVNIDYTHLEIPFISLYNDDNSISKPPANLFESYESVLI